MATEREFRRLRQLMDEIEPLLEDDSDENFEKLSKLWQKVFEITMDENDHHRDGFLGKVDRFLKKHGSLEHIKKNTELKNSTKC